jgi:hypothetical protein
VLFRELDANNDGKLSLREIKKGLVAIEKGQEIKAGQEEVV